MELSGAEGVQESEQYNRLVLHIQKGVERLNPRNANHKWTCSLYKYKVLSRNENNTAMFFVTAISIKTFLFKDEGEKTSSNFHFYTDLACRLVF